MQCSPELTTQSGLPPGPELKEIETESVGQRNPTVPPLRGKTLPPNKDVLQRERGRENGRHGVKNLMAETWGKNDGLKDEMEKLSCVAELKGRVVNAREAKTVRGSFMRLSTQLIGVPDRRGRTEGDRGYRKPLTQVSQTEGRALPDGDGHQLLGQGLRNPVASRTLWNLGTQTAAEGREGQGLGRLSGQPDAGSLHRGEKFPATINHPVSEGPVTFPHQCKVPSHQFP